MFSPDISMATNSGKFQRPNKFNGEVPRTIHLDDLTDESIDTIEHFGPNAAGILNVYSCTLEDALIATMSQLTKAKEETVRLQAILKENDINY